MMVVVNWGLVMSVEEPSWCREDVMRMSRRVKVWCLILLLSEASAYEQMPSASAHALSMAASSGLT